MGEDKKCKPGPENIGFEILLGEEACSEIDAEKEVENEIVESESRTVFIKKQDFWFY